MFNFSYQLWTRLGFQLIKINSISFLILEKIPIKCSYISESNIVDITALELNDTSLFCEIKTLACDTIHTNSKSTNKNISGQPLNYSI